MLFYKILLFTTLYAVSFSTTAKAQNYKVSGDTNYYIYETKDYKFIFSKEYEFLLPQLVQFNQKLKSIYQKEFLWTLDEPTSLVLVSSQNQIANAFATAIPFSHTAFYGAGMEFTNRFAASSWWKTLLLHETAHLYQLNVKRKFPRLLKRVLGNNAMLVLFGLPIVPQPNILTPTYIMEGNAVMNESRFGLGGRLYVGPIRALVYSLIKDKDFNFTRMINNHIDFPFTREKYLVGGYLQAYYSRLFSESTTNHFFSAQSRHWINPFILNSTHSEVFENQTDSFDARTLFDWFLMEHYSIALQQQTSDKTSFLDSITNHDMNSDENSVFFLANIDGRTPYQKIEISRSAHPKIKSEEVNLPGGKLFRIENQGFLSRASLQYDYDNRRYSLYRDGHYVEKEFIDQYLFDRRRGHSAYARSDQSINGNSLYVDGVSQGIIHSNAILDQDGHYYYFLQDKKQRSLYRDKTKLETYPNYFSRLLEVHEGHIYFIANTEFGSSLFSFKNGQTYRWHNSDTIVDARHIHGDQFIIREVSSKGYHHKIVTASPQKSKPFEYTYHWETKPEFEFFSPSSSTPSPPNQDAFDKKKVKPYVPIRNFRYSSLNPQLVYSTYGGWGGYLTASFIDPLFDNSFILQYSKLNHNLSDVMALYTNQTHRIRYHFGFTYDESGLIGQFEENGETQEKLLATYIDKTYFAGLTFPIFNYGLWRSSISTEFQHEIDTFLQSKQRKNSHMTSWSLSWQRLFPLSFESYRGFQMILSHKNTYTLTDREHQDSYVGQTSFTYDLGYESILKLSAGGGVSPSGDLSLHAFQPLRTTAFDFTRYSAADSLDLKELQKLEVNLKKVINQSAYSSYFPIGITRWAPTLVYNYYDLQQENDRHSHFSEWGGGVEFEFLLAHLATVRSSIIYAFDNQKDISSNLRINLNSRFEF